jgi:hypothetical protein
VDLTAPKPPSEAPKPEKPKKPAPKPRPPGGEGREGKQDQRRKPSGATLADLLDEATLARLRGEG